MTDEENVWLNPKSTAGMERVLSDLPAEGVDLSTDSTAKLPSSWLRVPVIPSVMKSLIFLLAVGCGFSSSIDAHDKGKSSLISVSPANSFPYSGNFKLPNGCISCKVEMSFGPSQNTGSVDPVRITFRGKAAEKYNGSFWIAVGFAPGASMGNAMVVECVAWNNRSRPQIDLFGSFNFANNTNVRTGNDGLNLISSNFSNGYLTCDFTINVLRSIKIQPPPAGVNLTFDLTQPYYLLLAIGPLANSTSNGKATHDDKRVSPAPVVVATIRNRVYGQCGKSRRCFGVPENCIATKTCVQLLSYGASENSAAIPVDLYGTAPNSSYADNFWVGFGSSITGRMESTSVVQCATYPDGNSTIVAAFNDQDRNYSPLSDRRLGISDLYSNYIDGILQCSFNLDVVRNVSGTVFDLGTPYYLLLGGGKCRLEDNSTDKYRPSKHIEIPAVIKHRLVMSCGNDCPCANGNCFGVPENCEEFNSCDLLLSWTQSQDKKIISIFMSGISPDPKYTDGFWVGFGVSASTAMANTAVIGCVVYPNGSHSIIAVYNGPGYSPIPLDDPHYGISNESMTSANGRLSCNFDMLIKRTMHNETFDVRQYFYVMLGNGPVDEDGVNYEVQKHLKNPRVSRYAIALASYSNYIYDPIPPTPSNNSTSTFDFPANCRTAGNCIVSLDYRESSTNSSRVSMVLRGPPVTTGQGYYLAVGINQIQKMEYAMVVECVSWMENSINNFELFGSYNLKGYKNQRLDTKGLFLMSSGSENGILKCEFETDIVRHLTVDVDPSVKLTFDLRQSYYLLLARGPLKFGSEKAYHVQDKVFSSKQVQVYNGGNAIPGVQDKTMKKAHAILMVIAWLWCASFGILNARQTKELWPDRQPFGLKMWFFLHRMNMVLVTLLSIIAIVIVFVDVGGWLDIPHAYTGIITFTLSLVQPTMATFRPHPGTPNRPYFNYFHWTLGYSALALSGVTMFLGLRLKTLDIQEGTEYIIVGTFAINIVLQIFLEIYTLMVSKSKENLVNDQNNKTATKEHLPEKNLVRYSIVILDWVLITAGSFTTVALIAQS